MINFTKKNPYILSLFFLFLSNYKSTETNLKKIPQESVSTESSIDSETNNKSNNIFDINTNTPEEKSSHSKDFLAYIIIGSLSLLIIIISIIVWKTCFSSKQQTQEEEASVSEGE